MPFYDKGLVPPYEIDAELPLDLPSGEYDLFVHNGSGSTLGWSNPSKVHLEPKTIPPTHFIKASDYGALPNDDHEDSASLARALAAAKALGGGTVQLDAGTYVLGSPVIVPENTILRGAGTAATTLTGLETSRLPEGARRNWEDYALVQMPSRCGLQDLTVRGASETPNVGIGSRNGTGENIAVNNCQIINRNIVLQPLGVGNGRPSANCIIIIGATRNLVIENCFIEGTWPIFANPEPTQGANIVGNTLQSYPANASDPLLLRKPVECLIENNYLPNSRRGIQMQPVGMGLHNLVANNRVEHVERGKNAGEVMLFEGGYIVADGQVTEAHADSLEIQGAQWVFVDRKGKDRDLRGDTLRGAVCLVTAGRGKGQYRLIRKLEGNSVSLTQPWTVLPEAGSKIVFLTGMVENLILNNTERDGDAALQFWGTSIGNVVSGHISDDTEGIAFYAADTRLKPGSMADVQYSWFNDVRLCRFEHGARLQFWPNRPAKRDYDNVGVMIFGNTVRQCAFGDSPRLIKENQWKPSLEASDFTSSADNPRENYVAIRLATKGDGDTNDPLWAELSPAATSNIIERDYIETGWKVGIYEALNARGNLIRNNFIYSEVPIFRAAESAARLNQATRSGEK